MELWSELSGLMQVCNQQKLFYVNNRVTHVPIEMDLKRFNILPNSGKPLLEPFRITAYLTDMLLISNILRSQQEYYNWSIVHDIELRNRLTCTRQDITYLDK
jgi:hypothetical protein